MSKKRTPEVLVILLAVLAIAVVITVFDKKIEKMNGANVVPFNNNDTSNNKNHKK